MTLKNILIYFKQKQRNKRKFTSRRQTVEWKVVAIVCP
jgi:hypothetical protein